MGMGREPVVGMGLHLVERLPDFGAARGRKGVENQSGDAGGIRTHVRERGYGVAVRAFSKSFSARAVLKTPQMHKRAR